MAIISKSINLGVKANLKITSAEVGPIFKCWVDRTAKGFCKDGPRITRIGWDLQDLERDLKRFRSKGKTKDGRKPHSASNM